jgi:hypothetical protein
VLDHDAEGTGLLSMVYGFVRQSGGHVTIDTSMGVGTTVALYMPRATQQPSVQADHAIPKDRTIGFVLAAEARVILNRPQIVPCSF